MNWQRARDVALGFLLCLAIMTAYQCDSASPTAAEAAPLSPEAPLSSNLQAVAAGTGENDDIHFAVIDVNTGEVKHMFRIDSQSFPMVTQ